MSPRRSTQVLEELGLVSLWTSTLDTKLLCMQRFVRLFAYGWCTLILVTFLATFQISKTHIGLFMTLTMAGDVLISLVLTVFADALGRKFILGLGALLMTGSGVVFAVSNNYWILLAAAILGVISPSGNEIGPFRAIEESALAKLTPAASRSDIFAWYALAGQAGTACGMMSSGWVMTYLLREFHWQKVSVYKAVFWGYAALGLIKLALASSLSNAVEAERKCLPVDSETAPLLGNVPEETEPKGSWFGALLPDIAADSKIIVFNLCLLFALDALASGLVPLSWVSFFFQFKFDLAEGKLGSIFFVTSFIAALSMLVASSLAKRIGNIQTMVFTHLPSSIFLALIPVPNALPFAILFLVLRSCTQSMDTAPRSAFLASVVRPNERTAVLGITNVVKTIAQSMGPLITGIFAGRDLFWLSFVVAGSLKVTYDLGMLAAFVGHKTIEDREEARRVDDEEQRSRQLHNVSEQ